VRTAPSAEAEAAISATAVGVDHRLHEDLHVAPRAGDAGRAHGPLGRDQRGRLIDLVDEEHTAGRAPVDLEIDRYRDRGGHPSGGHRHDATGTFLDEVRVG